ncbi:MAG: hypothetical protein ABSA33_02075, partial [Candidatus Micrarchaeaceae archaeon]
MITGFSILNVEGKINSSEALSKQRFPKLNINIDKVSGEGTKLNVEYSFQADYHEGEGKDSKSVGHIKLVGVVEVTESKEESASILKKWNTDHVLPVTLAEEIINGLNFRCNTNCSGNHGTHARDICFLRAVEGQRAIADELADQGMIDCELRTIGTLDTICPTVANVAVLLIV